MRLNKARIHIILLWRLVYCMVIMFAFETISAQTKRALVVGISDYQQNGETSWGTIHGANDVDLIVPVLKAQGFKTTKICNKEATATQIRKSLDNLIASCQSGDIVYLHFSCHGQPFEDLNGDEEDGWDESIIPYDASMVYQKGVYEGANHITDDELHTYFQKTRKKIGKRGFICIVIDACHAGGSSRGEEDVDDEEDEIFVRGIKRGFSSHSKDFRPRINANGHFQIPQEEGLADITILEACRSYQSNYEIKQDGKYYGPLSYYVCKILVQQNLARSTDWILKVKKMMNADKRLTRQNMVYETSIK